MYTKTSLCLVSLISFTSGVYIAQNYQIPNIKSDCQGAGQWTQEKWDNFRRWEQSKRK